MKVLDLQCSLQHGFEGWFGSEEDFQQQLARGLVECPICGSKEIHKLLSAPRLNLGASQPEADAKPEGTALAHLPDQQLQVSWLRMLRHVVSQTEDVGERFVEEARKMHYGEIEERGIRGQATAAETAALLEEGIAVMPLPSGMNGPLQ